jgi:hypothetical protein
MQLRLDAILSDEVCRVTVARRDAGGGDFAPLLLHGRDGEVEFEELSEQILLCLGAGMVL